MANPFVHVELNTTDVSKAKTFYVGWVNLLERTVAGLARREPIANPVAIGRRLAARSPVASTLTNRLTIATIRNRQIV